MEEKTYLEEYDFSGYEKPSVTNDIIIFTMEDKYENNLRKMPKKELQVLLVKRGDYPFKGDYAIPGGFVSLNEGVEEGAIRKLKEKTGISNVYLEQLYTFGEVSRDVRGRVITIAHMALARKKDIPKVDEECKWFWVNKKLVRETGEIKEYVLTLESEDKKEEYSYKVIESKKDTQNKTFDLLSNKGGLAFDHHKIIDYAVERLRNKLEYTTIAFNLLPEFFTVKELQNVYEGIMGREILNFRRKMGDMIEETEEKIEGKPFRPAKVYKFNENYNRAF